MSLPVDVDEVAVGEVGVLLRRGEGDVTEKLLDCTKVGSGAW